MYIINTTTLWGYIEPSYTFEWRCGAWWDGSAWRRLPAHVFVTWVLRSNARTKHNRLASLTTYTAYRSWTPSIIVV